MSSLPLSLSPLLSSPLPSSSLLPCRYSQPVHPLGMSPPRKRQFTSRYPDASGLYSTPLTLQRQRSLGDPTDSRSSTTRSGLTSGNQENLFSDPNVSSSECGKVILGSRGERRPVVTQVRRESLAFRASILPSTPEPTRREKRKMHDASSLIQEKRRMQEATLVRWLNHAIRYPEDLSINGRHLATITTTSSSLEDEEGMDLLVYRIYKQEHPTWRPCMTRDMLDRLMFILQYYSPACLHVSVMVLVNGSVRKRVRDSTSPFTWISLLIDPEGLMEHGDCKSIHYEDVIARLFGLVKLVDLAIENGVFQMDRPLFRPGSEVSSSQGILHELTPLLLPRGSRWVGMLQMHGYSVHHVQSSLDVLRLTIQDLGKDLQDAVGLLALVRSGSPHIKQNVNQRAQLPAETLSQRLHNARLFFSILAGSPFRVNLRSSGISPKDVVEGKKDRIMVILWQILLQWYLPELIPFQALQAEVINLKGPSITSSSVMKASQGDGMEGYRPLLRNFTVSFADGAALCFLIAHYRPDLMDARRVIIGGEEESRKRSRLEEDDREGSSGPGEASWYIPVASTKPESPAYVAWCRNVALLLRAIPHLPGMPMLFNDEFHPIPDDRSIILIVSYLSRSLLACGEDKSTSKSSSFSSHHRALQVRGRREQKAARVIQKAWREYGIRQRMLDQVSGMAREFRRHDWASRTIQSYWRTRKLGQEQREEFQKMQKAASLIQGAWRSSRNFRRRVEHERITLRERRDRRSKIILVQAQCRGWLVRYHLAHSHWAALRIQCAWRMHKAQCALIRLKEAAIEVQRVWRGWRVRRDLWWQWEAAIMIQRAWRGVQARRAWQTQRFLVIRCQAIVRGWLARRDLMNAWDAATRIQAAWRRFCFDERCRYRRWMREEEAAVRIQAAFRGYLARQAYLESLELREEAACLIQAAWRGHCVRREVHSWVQAAICIQRSWRGWSSRQAYLDLKGAVAIVEERWLARCQGEHLRHSLHQMYHATLVIQRRWRARQMGRWVRVGYQGLVASVIRIQTMYRGWAARKAYRELYGATLTLQRHWRSRAEGLWVHEAYQELRQATITLQAYTRGWIVRQRLWEAHFAAQSIQAAFRGWRTRRNLLALLEATLVIQRQWRARVQGEWVQEAYNQLRTSTILLQAHVRGWLVRQRVERARRAVLIIQAAFRGWKVRSLYQELLLATVTIQRAWRERRMIQGYMWEWRMVQEAAQVIQRHWRARQFLRTLRRRIEVRRRAQQEQRAALVIQTVWRGWAQRHHYHRMSHAATVISRWYRGRRDYARYQELRRVTLFLQRTRRHYLVERGQRRERAAWVIQRWWRITQGRYEDRARVEEAVRRIQAAWRGYRVRMETSRRVGEALARIRLVTKGAREEMRLGNRTSMALDILLGSSRMSEILGACVHLEVVTRLSRECRLQLLHHQAIEVLYEVLSGCNRSTPHQAVMRHALASLYHLSLDEVTAPHVLGGPSKVHLGTEGRGGGMVTKGMEVLLELLQRYRDALDVLGKVSLILYQLIVIRSLVHPLRRTPNAVRRLRSIINLVSRHVMMEERSHRALTPAQVRGLQDRRIIIDQLSAVASAGERKRLG
ncbi:MAG: hypothetical protein DHS80DRAFT_21340 [Piptocephalis tieghemiana]|nr:MAG: hypothetical protein DHS80DRAFT_21340 [Piptocephalis tieghemiana]